MRRFSIGVVLLAALLGFGAGGFGAAQVRAQAEPMEIEARGSWVHPASGMTFPEAVGVFARTRLVQYDAAGLDVSAGYNRVTPQGSVVVTVYVYPAPPLAGGGDVAAARSQSCREEFELRTQEVKYVHPSAQLVQSGVVPAPGGEATPGHMGILEFWDDFFGERELLHSELYVFCYVGGQWLIKYRITHPKAYDASRMIRTFMDGLVWTVRAQ